jgi:hypothetical protein
MAQPGETGNFIHGILFRLDLVKKDAEHWLDEYKRTKQIGDALDAIEKAKMVEGCTIELLDRFITEDKKVTDEQSEELKKLVQWARDFSRNIRYRYLGDILNCQVQF